MTTIVDLTLPGEALPLGALLTDGADRYVEFERVVPTGDDVMPFVWVSGEATDRVGSTVETLPCVESVERLVTGDGRHLFRVRWSDDVDGVVETLGETEGVILEGVGVDGRWELRLRFPHHEQLKAFGDRCRARGVQFEVGAIHDSSPVDDRPLTRIQLETLSVAYRLGYFEVPRRATLSDLSEHFGVTEQAISQRLRRALNGVLAEMRLGPG